MDEIEWEEIAKKARAGDKDAFIQLYETIYKDLYRFAFYTLQNQQDAEDVISETVLDAFAGTLCTGGRGLLSCNVRRNG